MKYTIKASKKFKRDYRKLEKSGKNTAKLSEVIDQLSAGETLDARYKDHPLKGNLKGIRECHIEPDWLLLYEKDRESLYLLLLRTGSHRDTLGIE